MFILGKIKQITLLFGDLLLLFASLYLTLLIRYSQTYLGYHWQEHFYPFSIIYCIWVVVFYSQNLYNLSFTKNNLHFFKTLSEAVIINVLISAFVFYFTPFFGIAPRTNLFLNAIIAGGLLLAWRWLFNVFTAKYLFTNRIAFLGYSKEVEELMNTFEKEPQLGYQCVSVVHDQKIENPRIRQITMEELLQNIRSLDINTIAMSYDKSADEAITNKIYKLIFSHLSFVNTLKLYEEITGKLPLEALSQGWFLENLQEAEKKLYDRLKLAIDWLLALLVGLALLIILPFVSVIILATAGRPIFYSQTRVGKNGKIFKIYKFRTMVHDAERQGAVFAEKNDARVTGFGKFLRKTRIDEMPQIINVLKGDMSFIGPRPERPEFVERLTSAAPFYPLRHLAKPGLTGWAQINYHYAGSLDENLKKLQYDIYYIKNRSFLLDAAIILKTFNIIIRFRGR